MNYKIVIPLLIALIVLLSLIGYFGYKALSRNKYDEIVDSFKENIRKCTSYIAILKDVEPMNFCDLMIMHKEIISFFPGIISLRVSDNGYFRGNISLENIYVSKKLFNEDISLQEVINSKSQKEVLASWTQYKSILLGAVGFYKQELKDRLFQIQKI